MQINEKVTRINQPPEADINDKFIQVNWIFKQLIDEQDNEKTTSIYKYARNKYLDYLHETSAYYEDFESYRKFELNKYWEVDALVRFSKWINLQDLTGKTKYQIYKVVRNVMDFAYAIRILESPVYHTPFFKGVLETEFRTSYDDESQDFINGEISRWTSLAISVLNGYEPTGKGIPYRPRGRGSNQGDLSKIYKSVGPIEVGGHVYKNTLEAAHKYGLDHKKVLYRIKKGWAIEKAFGLVPAYVSMKDDRALLWKFENEYGCDPLSMLMDFKERRLEAYATEADFRRLFMKWGVWPYIDDRLIMPLAVSLAMLTGLNVESIRSLKIDSYVPSHPLTHQAVIRFTKERSASSTRSADLDLHLSALEENEVYVDGDKVEEIHKIIQIIINLTSRIRALLPESIKDKLIVFEDVEASRKQGERVFVDFNPRGKAGKWYARFKRESGFNQKFGEDAVFNIAKFRPTVVTNMVLRGASLSRVQAVLSHSEISSTSLYLDERRLRPEFNKTMNEALLEISSRSKKFKDKSILLSGNKSPVIEKEVVFYETISGAGCNDPYNPSQNVRKASNYIPGSVCKFWNMCLLCDSSLITENSLPKIIIYSQRVKEAIKKNSPAIHPKILLLKQVDELLDGILEEDSIFSREVLEDAQRKSINLDDVAVDMLIYQGV